MATWETTAYYAFGLPIYAGVVAIESWAARRRGHPTPRFARSFGNLSAGLGSIAVGMFLGPALVLLYDTAWQRIALVDWHGAWITWPLALVLADLGHYLHHRLDHRVAACWAVHGVHHQPEEMNFTVAMRHAWFSDLYSFPFYAMLPLLGIPTAQFFVATTILSFHALITHSAEYSFPSFGVLVTPASHILHHAKNPRYVDKNFGAMFCVWDKLFGTHARVDPDEPVVYGTARPYTTHDGTLAQFTLWQDLLHLVRRTPGREKLRVLFGRPGTRVAGTPERDVVPPPDDTPRGVRIYVTLQFLLVVAAAHWVFLLRDEHPWRVDLAGTLAILAALATCGALLDRRRWAWGWEIARVIGTVALLLSGGV